MFSSELSKKVKDKEPSVHKEQQLRVLLGFLQSGDFYSGQALAEQLNVSRAYVWKLMQELQELGLPLESITGKGYRLNSDIKLLNEQRLKSALSPLNIECEVLLKTDSTNLQLKGSSFTDRKLLVAEYQSQGKGRRGRTWVSPLATNLYFSFAWTSSVAIQQLGGLSLLVGLSIINALESQGVTGLSLKWPNDIRHNGQKLAGILIELSGDAEGELEVIIGVGLNVAMEQQAGKSIEQQWTSVSQLLAKKESLEREALLIQCIKSLDKYLAEFTRLGFINFKEQWQQADECYGKKVTILQANGKLAGVGAGVDETGAFLLETKQGVQAVYAGEVSLRLD